MRCTLRMFTAIFLCSLSAWAQSAPPVDRLPKDTTFFFAWNGLATVDKARATNALLRLWDDSEFANVRQILVERAARASKTDRDHRSKEAMDALLDAAANPFILGMLSFPPAKGAAANAPSNGERAPTGFFVIYDRTGKAEVLERLWKVQAENVAEKPVITTSSFAGVTITKEETSKRASFSATTGAYYLTTDSKEVIEALLPRLTGIAPADSVISTAAYQAAALQRAPDAFCEFFFSLPDLTKLEIPHTQGMNFPAMLKGLHIERLQAVAASAGLAGHGTRLRAAAIGDTARGSVFDFFGASSGEFRTLALAPAGASYNATRFDLYAFYKTLRSALQAGLSVEQASQFEMMEGMLGAQLGMGIGEALQAISGEVASISLEAEGHSSDSDAGGMLGPQHNLYAVAIERPDDVLKLVLLVAGKNLTSETREGNATVLAVTMPYVDEKTGAQRKRFYYLGVTSNMLIVAPRKVLLREAISRAAAQQGPASSGLATNPAFTLARSRLPGQLNGLNYSDLSRMPWPFLVDSMIRKMNKKESGKLTTQEAEALRALPKILARYLHTSFGGSWKDRNGIFMESYIE